MATATASTQITARHSLRRQRMASNAIAYVFMTLLAVFFLFPLIYMMVGSIKHDEMQIVADMGSLRSFVPYGEMGIRNYFDVFDQMWFERFLFNSVFITATSVVLGLLVNSMIAYAAARLRYRGRALIVSLIIALIIIPRESVVIPLLLIVNEFGWLDSYQVQIVPLIANPFFVFLFYQFFLNIPKDLDEAAIVDGAGYARIYGQIIVPLSRPVFASVAILQGIAAWNEYLWPLMVIRAEEFRPLTLAIQQFFTRDPKYWGDIFAFSTMITLPILILFLLFQKWFVTSVASSGTKG